MKRSSKHRSRLVVLAVIISAFTGAASFVASPAFATTVVPSPTCVGSNCTITFATAGDYAAWTIPSGVTSIGVIAVGAGGGNVSGVDGGAGATVTTTGLSVSPGSQITVTVGGAGTEGFAGSSGAGGGGSSNLSVGNTVVIVAGGGGGGGN
jgi:hypothetical protein